MPLKSLQKVLIDELKDLYSAEQQMIKALPKMAKAVSSPQLAEAFEMHLETTRTQLDRLNQIASIMGEKEFKGKKCKAMEGLLEEGQELISEGGEPAVLDAALIGAAQKVEHYEIASYGTARTHARHLGLDDVASLLQETLDEEAATDKNLTKVAQKKINIEAQQQDGSAGHGRESRRMTSRTTSNGSGSSRSKSSGRSSRSSSSRKSSTSSAGSTSRSSSKSSSSRSASSRKALPRAAGSRSSKSSSKAHSTAERGTASRSGARRTGGRTEGGEDVGRGSHTGGMGGGSASRRESERSNDRSMGRDFGGDSAPENITVPNTGGMTEGEMRSTDSATGGGQTSGGAPDTVS